tara:strand:+ start:616 stop:783 length:168 start_codon:yes stop_codon:yes gene_type:complete
MKNWINKNGWLVSMLVGASLLFWAVAGEGEYFPMHVSVACVLIIIGASLSSKNNN